MANINEFRTGRHCVFVMHVHLVFVTKYRRKVLSPSAHETLRELFARICEDFEARLVESNGEDDHVHLLVEYPPKVAISKLVNSLKGVSSRCLRALHPEVVQRYYQGVLVLKLFCCLLWWSTFVHHSAVRGKPTTPPVSAMHSMPYISALKRRSFTASWVTTHLHDTALSIKTIACV